MDIAGLARKWEKYVIDLRRDFHRHPELSFQEERTSGRVREELDKMGIPYEVVPPHGVVATIACARPGKKLAIRADMDALPIQEERQCDYRSQNDGVMHACGHDGHTAMLLGAAAVLNELRSELSGSITLCFQSAEEIGKGAAEIIEHLKKTGGVDQVIAIHIMANLENGLIAVLPDMCMAGVVGWQVDVTGKGGHGSRPDNVHDPIKAACEMVLKLASIPSNFYNVLDPCVVTTGQISGGTLANIFPDTAFFRGSCRFFKPSGRERILECMTQIIEGVASANRVRGELKILGGDPPTINTPELAARARELVAGIDGLEVDETFEPLCGSDNYGNYLQAFSGFYAFLGVKNEAMGINYELHQNMFDMDESALRKGVEFFATYAADFLR